MVVRKSSKNKPIKEPQCVIEFTNRYKEKQSIVLQFIKDCLIVNKEETDSSELPKPPLKFPEIVLRKLSSKQKKVSFLS